MKKLFFFVVGVVLAACVISSCRKDDSYSPAGKDFIIAYSQVEPYNGKVNVEFPRSYEVENTGGGYMYIVICDCDNTKAGDVIPSRRMALPSMNPMYDQTCTDRSSVAYYGWEFYDIIHESVMYFNREEH